MRLPRRPRADTHRHAQPVVLRGGTAAIANLTAWTDEALLAEDEHGRRRCELADGDRWIVTVEKNNRITNNDRTPVLSGWDFCTFLAEYRRPDAPTYCITSITEEKRLGLITELAVPEVLLCEDLYRSMEGVRMWLSRGNTTSSQHFDTHDNLLFQVACVICICITIM